MLRVRARLFLAGLGMVAALAVVLAPWHVAIAQTQPQKRTITLNGHSGPANVIQFNGHSYVDLESLAQITNGAVGFRGEQITLTLPAKAAPEPTGLSREFTRASLEQLGAAREWVTTLAFAVRNGYPVTGTWVDDYRNRASERLRVAQISASTQSDHQAMQLLDNEFNNLQTWSNTLVAARNALNAQLTVNPSTVENDPSFQKLGACAQFLSSMLVSGHFEDSPNCH